MAFHNVPPNGFPDLPDVEELEAVEKDVKTLKTTTSEHGAAITALGTSKAAKADIAPTFSAESNYAVGDLVYYEGTLYECTTEHEAAAWDAENFTAASIDDELSSLKSGLTNVSGYVNSILTHAEFLVYRGNMGTDTPYTSKNFDDYRYDGIFSNGDTSLFTNAPTSNPDNGYLIAFSGNSTVQIWIGKYLGSLRARIYSDGAWSSWSNLINA